MLTFWWGLLLTLPATIAGLGAAAAVPEMDHIQLSRDQSSFVRASDATPLTPWGFNYDHDENGRVLEDYWIEEWGKVVGN